jgi:hypothetical protein
VPKRAAYRSSSFALIAQGTYPRASLRRTFIFRGLAAAARSGMCMMLSRNLTAHYRTSHRCPMGEAICGSRGACLANQPAKPLRLERSR